MNKYLSHPLTTTKLIAGVSLNATVDALRTVNNHTVAPVVNKVSDVHGDRKALRAAKAEIRTQMVNMGEEILRAERAATALAEEQARFEAYQAEQAALVVAQVPAPAVKTARKTATVK